MKEKAKFQLARLGIIVGSSSMIFLLGKLAYCMFTVPSEMSWYVKGLRFFAGSLVSLFMLGWVIVIPFTLMVGFEDFCAIAESEEDYDFDEYAG